MTETFDPEDAALRIKTNFVRLIEFGRYGWTAVATPAGNACAGEGRDPTTEGDFAYAVISSVAHIQGAVRPTGDARRKIQLGFRGEAAIAGEAFGTCASKVADGEVFRSQSG